MATVVYRTTFAGSNENYMPEVTVDYNDYVASRSGKVIPRLVNAGKELISYDISPVPVECIMTD